MTRTAWLRKSLLITAIGLGALCVGTWRAEAGAYVQTNLVSDGFLPAELIDPSLKNPWGVSHSDTSPFWTSNQGTSTASLFNVSVTPPVKNPTIAPSIPPGGAGAVGPTGQVNNGNASSFLLTNGDGGSARFIFANLNGTISGWDGGAASVIQATTAGAVYTGLAINNAQTLLYAANGAQNRIDVFDHNFANITSTTFVGKFVDPVLPAGLVPFNVQNIGGNIYVTYAPAGGRPNQIHVPEGNGAVAEFDANGTFIKQIISGSKLASPWGIALAPGGFGEFGGDLLVGNFSFDASEINAFDPMTGAPIGTIPIDDGGAHGGLWALNFGTGGQNGSPNTLFFTDGVNGEADGLFAALTPAPEPSSLALLAAAFGLFAARRARSRR
jgi:uncharacterized protein (TIGR03118 family)